MKSLINVILNHESVILNLFQDLNPKENRCRNKFGMTKSEGFTLIELLVVLAIIGIISTLLMTNFINVRQRGRDAQRKSDLRQLQAALEMYRADQGSYPNPSIAATCPTSTPLVGGTTTYMQKIPCDPTTESSYQYDGSAALYCLRACLENKEDSQKDAAGLTLPAACDTITACLSDKVGYTLQNP